VFATDECAPVGVEAGAAGRRATGCVAAQEAAYVCQGSAGGVMGMATSARDELWAAVAAGDGARVAAVADSALRLAPRARGDRRPSLPLRLYVRTGDTGAHMSPPGSGYVLFY